MRIAVIACDIFQKELDLLIGDDPEVVHKEYLEFALHDHPDDLKAKILEKVGALEGKVDVVFLGYAVCQSLKGIVNELPIPAVMLDADDCIGVFLMYFLKLMFEGYERCLFLDTGVPEPEKWESLSKDFACQLHLRHECRKCDLRMLEKGLDEARTKARG